MTHPTNEAAELYTAEAIDDGRGWVIPVEEGGIWYISRVAPSLLQERDRLPAEALEWARQLVEQGYRDEHIVTFTEDGYGLEHPIRCRPNLTGCVLNEWLRTQMAPDQEPGRYVMEWKNNGPEYAHLAATTTPTEEPTDD